MPERMHPRVDLRDRNIQRIGVLSDTHGWVDPRILDSVRDCDLIVHAGDVCGSAVLEALAEAGKPLVAVAGNNDRVGDYVTDTGRLLHLYEIVEIELAQGLLAVEHGHRHDWHSPAHSALRRAHPQADLVVYGHTHKLVCDLEARPWVINPGAAGAVRTRGGPSWICVEPAGSGWRVTPQRWQEAA